MQSRLGWKATTFAQLKRAAPFLFAHPVNRLCISFCATFDGSEIYCSLEKYVVLLTGSTKLLHLCGSSLIPPSGLLPRHCSFSCSVPVFKPRRRLCLCPPPGLQYGTATGRGQVRGQRSVRLYDELISHAACRRSSPSDRACSPMYQHLVCITWPHMLVYMTTLAAWRSG